MTSPLTCGEVRQLPAELRARTAQLVERFLAAVDDGASPPSPDLIERVFAASPFCADVAAANPAAFCQELARGDVAAFIAEPDDAFGAGASEADIRAALRRRRNLALAVIAWRDILGACDLGTTLSHISALADRSLLDALAWSEADLRKRFGPPCDAAGEPISLVIVAMGKLGGGELNFSSDVDLIFAYPASGETRPEAGTRSLENQDYFNRVGKRVIGLLSEQDANGFVYRVDMRLRPFGTSGALTASFDSLEQYYLVHGRDWERYALIKARIIGGTAAERARLERIFRPFVYRRYLDFGAVAAMRDMKARINDEVAKLEHDDVKRGSGGIREIEFIGQMFQLIRGGHEPALQARPICTVLRACVELDLLEAEDVDRLIGAYVFLRTTEHRLQQVADQQTHRLPDSAEEQARLAFGLGFDDWLAFEQALSEHRGHVQRVFADLLEARGETNAEVAESPAGLCWRTPSEARLAALGFQAPAAALESVERVQRPQLLARMSREGRERLDAFMPVLLERVATRDDAERALERLTHLVDALAGRSVYFALVIENPQVLDRLIDLYGASPWIAEQITLQPLLLDELIDPRSLFRASSREEIFELLERQFAPVASDDLEQLMNTLRVFRNQQVLRVAASDVTGHLPTAEVSNQLTWIAEAVLCRALDDAIDATVARHGRPRYQVDGAGAEARMAIIAYGKLGGLELGYGSDLDLVFVHDSRGEHPVTDGERSVDNPVFFTRATQKLIHLVQTRTATGTAYEVDTRLRPSGASGLLVSTLEAFAEYQLEKAWTWEHQALVRARGIAGPAELIERFEQVRRRVLEKRRDPEALSKDVREMRERMAQELDRSNADRFDLKHGPGGVTDIEFMVQYIVLRWSADHERLLTFTDNLRLLEIAVALGLLTPEQGRHLHDAYFAYRSELHRCALQGIDGLVPAALFSDHRGHVTTAWQELLA